MSRWHGELLAAARAVGRIAVLAGLLGAGLLGPVRAGAAERGAQQAAGQARKESPYARYAREHARTVERKPVRVRPSPSSAGHRARGAARAGRH